MTVPTGAGLVQEHEAGAIRSCGGQSRSNDRAGSMQTLHRVDIDVQWFL